METKVSFLVAYIGIILPCKFLLYIDDKKDATKPNSSKKLKCEEGI